MKIEFTTETLTPAENRALVTFLTSLSGVKAKPEYGPDDRSKIELMRAGEWPPAEERAPDGFPEEAGYTKTVTTNGPGIVATGALVTEGPAGRIEAAMSVVPTPGGLDSAGTPWDERIHASTRTTNKDGTWTRRRNTPDEVFTAVMAELKGAPAAPPPPPHNTDKGGVGPDGMITLEPSAAEAFSAAPPPPPPWPAAPPATGAPTFVAIMGEVTKAQAAGTMTGDRLKEILAQCGLDGLGKLATADDGTRSAVMALVQG